MTQLQTLVPQQKDLGGGFLVRRLLPAADRRSVGPFVFFDHFGPVDVPAGAHHDVRPHPHIGLATLTYLLEGAIVHRDSTGIVQRIEPGAVNWMSAGRGIVHSERTPKELIGRDHRSHGLQFWVALPEALEDSAPSFQHVPAERIPRVQVAGATVDVIVGSAFGATSPVETASPTLAALIALGAFGAPELVLPAEDANERALYPLDHPIEVEGDRYDECRLVVLTPGTSPRVVAPRGGRVVLVGGQPLGHRFLSWNFVATSRERIRAAEDDWRGQRFAPVPGETEFIPLPERPPRPAGDATVPGAA
ncbi:MAG: pirin family protein [Rhizobacter sp.]|nr:pirin family protein [Rhizobacter sp.]